MYAKSQSAIVRQHLRRATIIGWSGYYAGLFAATALGLSVFALAHGSGQIGLIKVAVTLLLGGTVIASLLISTAEAGDRNDQWYVYHARRTAYRRNHPKGRMS